MGICIALRTEKGKDWELIPDDKNVLHALLPMRYTEPDSLLGWIDWFGDTMFNRVQRKRFLEEWDGLAERAKTPEEQKLLASIRALAVKCRERHFLYLWFIRN